MARPGWGRGVVAALLSALAIATALPAAASARDRPVRFTVAATGDLLTHWRVLDAARVPGSPDAYDFRPLLSRLESRIRRADLALCHQEVVIGQGTPFGQPPFLAPPSLATAIGGLGFDACSVASNHAVDHGEDGIASTNAALRAAGLRHTGTYLSEEASRRPLLLRVKGIRVALLSYTEHTNGVPLPEPFSVDLFDRREILADARRARHRGADAVIVNLHDVGDLNRPVPVYLRRLVRGLAASQAITAIVGQGPHLVRPIRFIDGKPVVYSDGDLLSANEPDERSGLIAELHFVASEGRVEVESVRYVPLRMRPRDRAVMAIGRAFHRNGANRAALRAAYREIVGVAGRSRRVGPVPRRLPGG